MKSHYTTVIIGGGISGLATAWWLTKSGVDVAVVECDAEVGGTMKTIKEEGYLIETGPNSALETTPLFQTLVNDLGIQEQFTYADERSSKRYILRNGALHPLPMTPPLFLKSRLWTMKGKLRLLKEPFVGRAVKEESIAEFVERRLGKEFLDYAINPFVAGVYAGNPEELSVRAAFPKLYALEEKYGSLIKGQIKGAKERKKRAEQSKQSARMFSFHDGMSVLPNALRKGLTDRVILSTKVELIERNEDGYLISGSCNGSSFSISADSIVTAVPSAHVSSLVQSFDRAIAEMLRKIYYPPVTEVFLGYRTDDIGYPLDGFGFLIPAKEKRNILGTIWSSSLFPNRAPEGHAALTTFVGGSRQPELTEKSDEQLIRIVTDELKMILAANGSPTYVKINRWKHAIPQYRIGHLAIVEKIEAFERQYPGLFISGNFKGGISVGDCVISSEKTAQQVTQYLQEKNFMERNVKEPVL